jgi:hypothetical protein
MSQIYTRIGSSLIYKTWLFRRPTRLLVVQDCCPFLIVIVLISVDIFGSTCRSTRASLRMDGSRLKDMMVFFEVRNEMADYMNGVSGFGRMVKVKMKDAEVVVQVGMFHRFRHLGQNSTSIEIMLGNHPVRRLDFGFTNSNQYSPR